MTGRIISGAVEPGTYKGVSIITDTSGRPIEASFIPTGDDHDRFILDEAARLVNGDRQAAYGHPADNHRCTAELWNAYLARRWDRQQNDPPLEVDAFDVCMLNILQKVSRLAHTRQRDGLVDIAGFAANADMVAVADS